MTWWRKWKVKVVNFPPLACSFWWENAQRIAKERFWGISVDYIYPWYLCLLAKQLELGFISLLWFWKYSCSFEFKHLNLYDIKYTNRNIAQWGKGNNICRNHILIHLQEFFEEIKKGCGVGASVEESRREIPSWSLSSCLKDWMWTGLNPVPE